MRDNNSCQCAAHFFARFFTALLPLGRFFPTPYHVGSPLHQLQSIVLMAKASLELCCQLRLLPSIVVTNDWYTGLLPAYGQPSGAFGRTFEGTTFFHLVHNLEKGYEGKIYPQSGEDLAWVHQLPRHIVEDQQAGEGLALNASQCALLTCNQWGTVSKSYRHDLLRVSPLAHLLARFEQPFAHSNGIVLADRLAALAQVAPNHDEAKAMLQRKYFGREDPDAAVLAFIGRVVLQKGVHLICNCARELISTYGDKIMLLVGGPASKKDPYAGQCAWSMEALRREFPEHFWADPNGERRLPVWP